MPPGEPTIQVQVRLTPSQVALLDAWAAHLTTTQGVRHSRADVVRRWLARVTPPTDEISALRADAFPEQAGS